MTIARFFIAALFAFLILRSVDVHAQNATVTVSPSDDEYRVYDAILAKKFSDAGTDFGSLSDGRLLVIRDRTIQNDTTSDELGYVKQRINPSAEALSDYTAKRESLATLNRKFATKAEYVLLSEKAWESIFQSDRSSNEEDAWTSFYKQYPKSGGYIAFSRVGFNKSKSDAILYFEHSCGYLCASGYYITLHKRSNGWDVKDIVMVWIS